MISLVATVLNEKKVIADWLSSLVNQSKLPDEIIIVDGGSSDGTWEWLQEKRVTTPLLKVFQRRGNISTGRNYGIAQAMGEIIAVTDSGCTYRHDWLEKLIEPLLNQEATFAATGFGPWLKPDDSLVTHVVTAATIPAPEEFKKDWLPSSRSVAFTKSLWHTVGGYPEWIPICEDVIFDLKIVKWGTKPYRIREPLVRWRPRTTLAGYVKQLFGYTRSDGHGKLWLYRQLIRYGTYTAGAVIVYLGLTGHYAWWALIVTEGMLYMHKYWTRWFEFSGGRRFGLKLVGFLLLPFIVMLGDLAKMAGWPVGVYERLTGKIKFETW